MFLVVSRHLSLHPLIRRAANTLIPAIRHRGPYALTLAAGATLGLLFGEMIVPAIDDLVGEPLLDVVMALGGAALAGIAYEIAASLAHRN